MHLYPEAFFVPETLYGRLGCMDRKLKVLQQLLSDMDRVLIAFSGGVDSTLLLAVARDILVDQGNNLDRIKAVIVDSPTLPRSELIESRRLASLLLGAPLEVLKTKEMDLPQFIANTPQRCYFCKDHRYQELNAYAQEHGYDQILDGSNADDLKDFRPGQKAAQEQQVRSPLQEAGFTKHEIRELARELGLPNWNKPSSACLASRIPYGTPITVPVLNQIEAAENILSQYGITQCRVRHHDKVARIEVVADDFKRILDISEEIVPALENLGYDYISLDLKGFKSGSMNKGLTNNG